MVRTDGEGLRINEGLWISASLVAGQEISKIPSPANGDSPEHPVSIIKASDLGQRVVTQEGDRIFLGTVSGRSQHSYRTRPGTRDSIRCVLWQSECLGSLEQGQGVAASSERTLDVSRAGFRTWGLQHHQH